MPTPEPNPFVRILVRQVSAQDPLHGALFHLWWLAPDQGDRLVQVYANARLDARTLDFAQRELWLLFPAGQPVRLDLKMVPPSEVLTEDRDAFNDAAVSPQDIASITVLRDAGIPPGASVDVAVDGGVAERAPLFGVATSRIGFGSLFGFGGFGFDAATGPGLGLGALGLGPLGADGEPWCWRRDDLSDGPHVLTTEIIDSAGRVIAGPETQDIDIDRLPASPMQLAVAAGPVLSWT